MNLRDYQKKIFKEKILKKLQNIDKNINKIQLKKEIYEKFQDLYLKYYNSLKKDKDIDLFLDILAFYSLDASQSSFLSEKEIIADNFNKIDKMIDSFEANFQIEKEYKEKFQEFKKINKLIRD